jgi:putative oxidoreductase
MAVIEFYDDLTSRLRSGGEYVWPLALRLILAWEFWEAGITKLNGSNWFADIPWSDWQKGFPLPFDMLPVSLNWFLATWAELVFAAMLLLGLFTRFAAISLVVVSVVAMAAVHWPAEWTGVTGLWEGYVITSKGAGNFKLPLILVVMLLPLVFHGAGRISSDYLLISMTARTGRLEDRNGDLLSAGLALLVLGIATIWVEPIWGFTLLSASVLLMLQPLFKGRVKSQSQ